VPIREAHDGPPNQVTPFPMAVVWCEEVSAQRASLGGAVSLQATLMAEIHVAQADIERALGTLKPYMDLIPELIWQYPTLQGTVTSIGTVRQEIAAEEWTGVETLCLRASFEVVIE
jgi:hypothetical protein